jgi:hypothetical protein
VFKICVVHLGSLLEVLPATSLFYGLRKKYENPQITWIVSDQVKHLFKYTKDVFVFAPSEASQQSVLYDLVINLSPNVHPADPFFVYRDFIGFNGNPDTTDIYQVLYGQRKTKMNQFQPYFRLAGLVWRGEGYGIRYFPKNKTKKDSLGIAITHDKLQQYLYNGISGGNEFRTELCDVTGDIFTRLDSLNKFDSVLTNDLLTANFSLFLRKELHFLETRQLSFNLEIFNSGRVYRVPEELAHAT